MTHLQGCFFFCVCVCVHISDQIPIKDWAKSSTVAETVKVVLTTGAGSDALGQFPNSDVNWGSTMIYRLTISLHSWGKLKIVIVSSKSPKMSYQALNYIFLPIQQYHNLTLILNIWCFVYVCMFCVVMFQIISLRLVKTWQESSLGHQRAHRRPCTLVRFLFGRRQVNIDKRNPDQGCFSESTCLRLQHDTT